MQNEGLPPWLSRYRTHLQCRRCRRRSFDSWVGKRAWQPTPVFLSGESHGQRTLADCGPQHHKESDTSEQLSATCAKWTCRCPVQILLNFPLSCVFLSLGWKEQGETWQRTPRPLSVACFLNLSPKCKSQQLVARRLQLSVLVSVLPLSIEFPSPNQDFLISKLSNLIFFLDVWTQTSLWTKPELILLYTSLHWTLTTTLRGRLGICPTLRTGKTEAEQGFRTQG